MSEIKYCVDINLQNNKVINVPTPTQATDVANKNYVDEYIQGLSWKDEVTCSPVGNIDITNPGSTIDGFSPSLNDRILLKSQTNLAENGIYNFDTSTTTLVRSQDANSMAELKQAIVTITNGTTNGGTTWRQATNTGVIGTADVIWNNFGVVTQTSTETIEGKAEIATLSEVNSGTESGAKFVTPYTLANTTTVPHKYSSDIGNGSDTSITVTHNLGTKNVVVCVYDNSSPFSEVSSTINHTTDNTLTIFFNTAPTSNQYKVVILG